MYEKVGMIFVSETPQGWKLYVKKGADGKEALVGLQSVIGDKDPIDMMHQGLMVNNISDIDKNSLTDTKLTYTHVYHSPKDDSVTVTFAQKVSPEFIHAHKGQLREIDVKATKVKLPKQERSELEDIIHRALPGMAARLMGESGILKPNEGFLGKTIRADALSYFDDFMESTPVKGLSESSSRTSPRTGSRRPNTARGLELIDLDLREAHGIGQQYTDDTKKKYSHAQSVSLFNPTKGTPAFGFNRTRQEKLVGVINLECLPNRLFLYDGGTVGRPYDGDSKDDLREYVKRKTETGTLFDISDWDKYQEAVKDVGDANYNEILARVAWTPEQSKICVFTDTDAARWLAIHWSHKMSEHVRDLAEAKYGGGELGEDDYMQLKDYQASISYYYFEKRLVGEIQNNDIVKLKQAAQSIFNDETQFEKYMQTEQFEFILMQESGFGKIVQHAMFQKILNDNPVVALHVIEKYHAETGSTIDLDKFETQDLVPNQYLKPLVEGKLATKHKDQEGKFKLHDIFKSNNIIFNHKLRKYGKDLNFEKCWVNISEYEVLEKFCAEIGSDSLLKEQGLSIAIFNRNTNLIDKLLVAGANVNVRDFNDSTPLMRAAHLGDKALCVKLIKAGADIHLKNNNNDTALIYAVNGGHDDVCALLLKMGADVNVIEVSKGRTPLMIAAKKGNISICQQLIEAGADIQQKSKKNMASLNYALKKGHGDICALLIDSGADIYSALSSLSYIDDTTAKTLIKLNLTAPAHIEALNRLLIDYFDKGAFHKCEILIKTGADKQVIIDLAQKAIIDAANKNNWHKCVQLLSFGADKSLIKKQLDEYVRALVKGRKDQPVLDDFLFKDLIMLGWDPNARLNDDPDKNTVLMDVARKGGKEIISYLIKAGADLNATNDLDKTALMIAIECEQEEICKTLIDSGADLNIYRKNGMGALYMAAEMGLTSICFALIEHGADLEKKAGAWGTPLGIAAFQGDWETCAVLLKAGANAQQTVFTKKIVDIFKEKNRSDLLELVENKKSARKALAESKPSMRPRKR